MATQRRVRAVPFEGLREPPQCPQEPPVVRRLLRPLLQTLRRLLRDQLFESTRTAAMSSRDCTEEPPGAGLDHGPGKGDAHARIVALRTTKGAHPKGVLISGVRFATAEHVDARRIP